MVEAIIVWFLGPRLALAFAIVLGFVAVIGFFMTVVGRIEDNKWWWQK